MVKFGLPPASDLQRQNEILAAAVDNMPQGLVMYDASARLLICNASYREMYALSEEDARQGTTLQELIRNRIARGTLSNDVCGDLDQYVAYVQAEIADGKATSMLCELPDGRTIAINNRPMPCGGWIASHEDITEVRQREASFQLLFDSNPIPMWVSDRKSLRFLAVNDAAVNLYGYSREQFLRMTVPELRPIGDRKRFAAHLRTLPEVQNSGNLSEHLISDGTAMPIAAFSRALTYVGHQGRLAVIYDITRIKAVEDELGRTRRFLDTVIENAPVPIIVKTLSSSVRDASECRYTLVNRAFEELFGDSRENIIGKPVIELYPKEQAEFIIKDNDAALHTPHPIMLSDHPVKTRGNGIRIATATTVAVRDANEKPQYLLTVLQDVTERRKAEQHIARVAHYDPLTDIPNRITFNDTMEVELERAARNGERFAVLILDLDGFKEANDTHGHAVGDALLREIARRLETVTAGAFVARIGGDEFAVIVRGSEQPKAAEEIAQRIFDAIKKTIEIDGWVQSVGVTIGGAIYPADGTDASKLMISADIALYRAKADARGSLLFFDAQMAIEQRKRRALEDGLRIALEHDQFRLHYQPQSKMTGETIGFEALLRWHSFNHGTVSPEVFVPIAEKTGLIESIGEWVLREACREAASWNNPLTIAVNVSPVQFRSPELIQTVHSILVETGLAPSRLELEITESVFIDDFSRGVSVLRRLKALGVRIALDDFGTGYSSLSYVHAFPFDKIKIDRSFIRDLERNAYSIAIVRAVIDLGQSLGIPVLAEGVENARQHAILHRKGCDEIQGYFTGHPSPIEAYATHTGWLADRPLRANG